MRALSASSLLLASQAKLQEQMTALPATELWEEICVITDHCLPLTKCTVQSVVRSMSTLITREQSHLLFLSKLPDKKINILNEV